jgi:hypothetical protein
MLVMAWLPRNCFKPEIRNGVGYLSEGGGTIEQSDLQIDKIISEIDSSSIVSVYRYIHLRFALFTIHK